MRSYEVSISLVGLSALTRACRPWQRILCGHVHSECGTKNHGRKQPSKGRRSFEGLAHSTRRCFSVSNPTARPCVLSLLLVAHQLYAVETDGSTRPFKGQPQSTTRGGTGSLTLLLDTICIWNGRTVWSTTMNNSLMNTSTRMTPLRLVSNLPSIPSTFKMTAV